MKVYPRIELGGMLLGQSEVAQHFGACPLDGTLTPSDCPADVIDSSDITTSPWWNASYDASNRFLGVWVDEVSGIDTPVSTRASAAVLSGGSVAGAWSTTGRGIVVSGMLYASADDGMAYGQRFLTLLLLRFLDGTAVVRVACDDADDTGDGLRTLFGVTCVEPPTFTPIDGIDPGLAVTFTISLVAGDPWLYSASAAQIVTAEGATEIDDPHPVCTPDVPFTLDCDPLAPLPLLPFGATYDDSGRPSCGPGSQAFDSGVETIVYDSDGRPSSGPGSAHWLDTEPIDPVWDWLNRPSCGANSGNFGAQDADQIDDIIFDASEQTELVWQSLSVTADRLLPAIAFFPAYGPAQLVFTLSGAATYRDVYVEIYAVNRNAEGPDVLFGSGRVDGTVATTTTIDLWQFMPTVPGGDIVARGDCEYRVVVTCTYYCPAASTFDISLQALPSGTSTDSGKNGGVAAFCAGAAAGPNGGSDRDVVTACVTHATVFPVVMSGQLPLGYWERPEGDPYDDMHGWMGLRDAATSWAGDEASALAATSSDDAAFMSGLVTPTGFGWATFFMADGFGANAFADVCSGSDIRWVRIRARGKAPVKGDGPYNAVNPEARWTVRAVLVDGVGDPVPIGGVFHTNEPWNGEERTWVFWCSQADLANLQIVTNLAVQGGNNAQPGELSFLAVDLEYVGGTDCLDCGPNDADVACGDSSPFRSTCWTEPTELLVTGSAAALVFTPGPDWVPGVAVVGGKNLRVKWYADIGADPASDWATYHCMAPLAVLEVPEMPSGWTLTIDGRARTAVLTNGGQTVEATRYISGLNGAPWVWPVFFADAVAIIEQDAANPPSSVVVSSYSRETSP